MDKNGPDQSSEHATDQPNIGNDTLLTPSVPTHPLSQLPRLRRNLLYTVLCIALSLDALSTSSMFTSTEIIAADIGLAEGGNAIWIVSASAMASAAFIPLGGRLADVLPPRWWFVGGFVGMTGLTLGNSFVKDKKLFLALRSLQGVCAALTLPSGFSMIVHMYPDHAKQRTRLIVTSVIYSMGVACGFIVGGLLVLVNWRWIFRFLAIVACLVSFAGWILIPGQCTLDSANDDFVRDSTKEIIKKLDLIGVFLIMGSLLLFNLALTSATVFSWSNARVIAPLVLSLCLLPAFCIWEAKQDVRYAMLPVAIMKKAKFLVVCFTGMAAETWFSTSQLGPSRYFQDVLHNENIVVAGKLCAQVVGCAIGGLVHTFYISKRVPPKYTLLVGMLVGIAPGSILLILSNGGKGMDYWRYIAPSYLIGAIAMVIVRDAANVIVIQGVPSEYSGIASSVFVMSAQTGIVIGPPIQAAFYTAAGGGISNWRGSQYGFYFVIGLVLLAMVAIAIWLPMTRPNDDSPSTFQRSSEMMAPDIVEEKEAKSMRA